jgi:hypothetical protein
MLSTKEQTLESYQQARLAHAKMPEKPCSFCQVKRNKVKENGRFIFFLTPLYHVIIPRATNLHISEEIERTGFFERVPGA